MERALLAADPEPPVWFAHRRPQRAGHALERLVTHRVPMFVVDQLEVLDVEQGEGERSVAAPSTASASASWDARCPSRR